MSKYAKSSDRATGVGIFDVLQIVFIVLKLIGVIEWSWWAVLSPLWIVLALVLLLVITERIVSK